MGQGLQRAENAARATRGLPPKVVHLIVLDDVTACGRFMSKTMHGTWEPGLVTCKQCLAAESDRLDLSDGG